MHIVSPLVFHHGRRIAVLLGSAGIVCAVLVLLAYVVMLWTAMDLPRLDGPELGPFRWSIPDGVA
jgi:hypothetical protein